MCMGRKSLRRTKRGEMGGPEKDRDLWLCWQCVAQPTTVEAMWSAGFTGVVSIPRTGGDRHNTMNECTQWAFNFISEALIVQCRSSSFHMERSDFFPLSFRSSTATRALSGLDPTIHLRRLHGIYLSGSTWLIRSVFKCCSCWNSLYVLDRYLYLSVCLSVLAHPLTSWLDRGR